ncbi:dihydrofolate reductase [Nocardioides sp. GY 10113]|uniref:dihydrofolate reductase family protein n=1 Tax=Nocardioides sp. GY 10113 TaxID=2569761 RepID=UPI0010A8B08F|nr:dihydrofolate reductase family protein [Nocardioides sp. GY 10113]TIC85938.1 dihydrofolate reductase [Nocardioides sp. GY 10113]
MSRVVFYTATTLDGFLADPDDSLDWLMRQEQDHQGALNYEEFIAGIGALVMGSTTYEWVRDNLERSGEAWPYELPTWVMSSRDLPAVEGADLRFARGDVRAVHAAMLEAVGGPAGKDLWVVGGGDLAGQFADAGLLDEVVVYVAPVVLGAGRPLLPRRLDLELLEATQNKAFVAARYRVLGPLAEDRPA